MGTRALIGYLDTDGDLKLTSTYNHWDGYPQNLGKGLESFYDNDGKAKEIANVGYISFLDGETGEWEAANKSMPDVTQLPDNFNEAMMEIAEEIDSFGADYGYVWDNENQEWITVKNEGIGSMAKNLALDLSHLKGKFEISPEQTMEAKKEVKEAQEEDVLGDWISDMLKYKSYDEVKQIVQTALSNAGAELNTGEELDEHFINKMKFRAGIVK